MMEAYGNAHAPRWYPGVAQLSYGQEDIGTVCQKACVASVHWRYSLQRQTEPDSYGLRGLYEGRPPQGAQPPYEDESITEVLQ